MTRRWHLVFAALLGAFLLGVVVLDRTTTLVPVEVLAEDILCPPGVSAELRIEAVLHDTGSPAIALPLVVTAPNGEDVRVTTGAAGELKLPLAPMEAGVGEVRIRLGRSARHFLISPWAAASVGDRVVRLTAHVVSSGSRYLLVDLDGTEPLPDGEGLAGCFPGEVVGALRRGLEQVSRKADHVLYLSSRPLSDAQRIRCWIVLHGLPPGVVRVRKDDEPPASWLSSLHAELRELGASVTAVVSARGSRELFRDEFPLDTSAMALTR